MRLRTSGQRDSEKNEFLHNRFPQVNCPYPDDARDQIRIMMRHFFALVTVFCLGSISMAALAEEAPPQLPAGLRALKIEPSRLVLHDGRDERRLLIWAETDSGERIDVNGRAVLQPGSEIITVDAQGYVVPKARGETKLIVSLGELETAVPVDVKGSDLPPVRFVRDIEPLLSKVGCNAGTCHGSANGKNGFKLSLRGYDPDFDYQALVNDISGRRFNRVVVDQSLMLLKPAAEVPHEGGQLFKPASREYQLLRQWIAEGARQEDLAEGRAIKLEIFPGEIEMAQPGETQQVLVLAQYRDGSVRDVTRQAVFSSNDEDVATVHDGVVSGLRRGEAAVLIRYEGLYAAKLVTIMGDRTGFAWVDVPEHNSIDTHVHAKLRKMKILPSELCTDAEFIRRVHLDLTGMPPGPERVRAFLSDPSPSRAKRDNLVDELLAGGEAVDFWSNKWADLLQLNSETLGQKGVWLLRNWIKQSVAQNKPYDQFVRELLSAEGSSFENPAANYFRVLREPGKMTEDISQTFLGVRFNCNKCHDHPFERWTQNQYYEFGAYFAQVALKRGTLPGEEVVYRNFRGGEVRHPKNDLAVAPKVPFGTASEVSNEAGRRDAFVDWITSAENPLFARAMANRVWSYFFGRGIIEPVDDIRASNPPSNPELLDNLAADFVKSGFDLRRLMETICKSRTYQLSIIRNKWNEDDTINFASAMPRRLSAEQLYDAIAVATGRRPTWNGMPAGMRAVEIADGTVPGDDFLALFGRPKRQSACECERTSNITLSHTLNLINGVTVGDAIESPDNNIARLVKTEKDNRKLVEEIYLACLNRPPSEKELAAADQFTESSRLEVAQDLVWALLNSSAFLFNR
jgi:hypothetical protein